MVLGGWLLVKEIKKWEKREKGKIALKTGLTPLKRIFQQIFFNRPLNKIQIRPLDIFWNIMMNASWLVQAMLRMHSWNAELIKFNYNLLNCLQCLHFFFLKTNPTYLWLKEQEKNSKIFFICYIRIQPTNVSTGSGFATVLASI